MPEIGSIETMTLKQLVESRPDLVAAIKANEDEGSVTSNTETDGLGRIKTWTEEQRDLDGALLGRRVDAYAYYPTGEIDTIVCSVYDGAEVLVSRKTVKHFLDGRQPEVTKEKV